MILSLELENWKSHSKSEFHFNRGTNVLLGRMGSGKSSVLDALCFALYGTFPKMSRRDQGVDDLVSLSSDAQYARVQAEFEKGGKKYTVERKIGKKISDAEAREEGKLVQKSPKAVTEYITSVLGVDYELFTRAIYSEQNRIDYLLSLNPKARKQEIDWLLGLGQFDSAREGAQAAQGKLSEQAELFGAEARPEKIAQAEKKALGLASQEEERKALLEKIRQNIGELALAVKKASGELDSLEKLRKEWQGAQSDAQRLSGAVERLRRECEGKGRVGAERIATLSEERKKCEDALLAAREKIRNLQLELSSSKSNLAVAENNSKAAQESGKRKGELSEKLKLLTGGRMTETVEKELAEEKSELENMVQLHAALHAQEEELQKSVAALSTAGAKCPVCDSDLSGGKAEKAAEAKKKQIEEGRSLEAKHLEEIAGKKKKVAGLESSLMEAKSCQSELERLSKSIEDASALGKKIAELKAAKEKGETELQAHEKEIGGLDAALEKSRAAHEEAQRAYKLFSELDESLKKLSEAQQRLQAIAFDEKGHEAARAVAEASRVGFARAEAELSGEQKQLTLLQQMLSSERESLALLRQKGEMARKYTEAASSMAIFKNSLVAAQSELRSTLIEEINAALAEVWPAVYPYSDYGAVKIEADEKDYRLLMEKSGWRGVDSVASGGERACLCLALRIAFATVLTPDVSWLILDEPTHNLDSEAVQMLSEAINEKIPSIVEQTFVITHDPLLGEAGSGAVFRLERDKSKNESTRVS